jgi:hypothetical protein
MLSALLAHGAILGVGVALTLLLWPEMCLFSPAFWGRVLLLGPLGLSLQFLLQVTFELPFGMTSVVWVWFGLGGVAVLQKIQKEERGSFPSQTGFLLLLGFLLFGLSLGKVLQEPIHEGDALTNFALPARVFAEAKGVDFAVLPSLGFFGHVEYPPLLAASEALVFQEAGDGAFLWNQLFGPLALLGFFFLLAGQWFGEDPLPGPYAWLALGIVFGTPLVLFLGFFATADLRLLAAFFLLGIEAQRKGGMRKVMILMVLGLLCAMTKVEGLLGALVVVFLIWRNRKEWGESLKEKLGFLGAGLGTITLLFLWPALLMVHGISLFQSPSWGIGSERMGERLSSIKNFVANIPFRELPLDHPWLQLLGIEFIPVWGLVWVFVLYLVLRFMVQRRKTLRAHEGEEMGGVFLSLFFLHIGLFFVVFFFTPREIQWHLNTAGDRFLLVTLAWPLLLVPKVFQSVPKKAVFR